MSGNYPPWLFAWAAVQGWGVSCEICWRVNEEGCFLFWILIYNVHKWHLSALYIVRYILIEIKSKPRSSPWKMDLWADISNCKIRQSAECAVGTKTTYTFATAVCYGPSAPPLSAHYRSFRPTWDSSWSFMGLHDPLTTQDHSLRETSTSVKLAFSPNLFSCNPWKTAEILIW